MRGRTCGTICTTLFGHCSRQAGSSSSSAGGVTGGSTGTALPAVVPSAAMSSQASALWAGALEPPFAPAGAVYAAEAPPFRVMCRPRQPPSPGVPATCLIRPFWVLSAAIQHLLDHGLKLASNEGVVCCDWQHCQYNPLPHQRWCLLRPTSNS